MEYTGTSNREIHMEFIVQHMAYINLFNPRGICRGNAKLITLGSEGVSKTLMSPHTMIPTTKRKTGGIPSKTAA